MLELVPRKDGRTFVALGRQKHVWIERIQGETGTVIAFYEGEPVEGAITEESDSPDNLIMVIKESFLRAALDNLDGHKPTVVNYDQIE